MKKKQQSIDKKEYDILIDKLSMYLKSCPASREDPTRACHTAGITYCLNCRPKLRYIQYNRISNINPRDNVLSFFFLSETLVRAVTARSTIEYIMDTS